MYLHLNTVLEEVVDPLSIDYLKNKNNYNDQRPLGVVKNLHTKSYLLGVLYFAQYLNPNVSDPRFDHLLLDHSLELYMGGDFNTLHAHLKEDADLKQLDFLKGVWYAYEFL